MPLIRSPWSRPAVSSWSADTGMRNVIRTLMRPFDPTRAPRVKRRPLTAHYERRAHARLRVTRQRAPELPRAGAQRGAQLGDVARARLADRERGPAPHPLQAQVVRVFTGVVE